MILIHFRDFRPKSVKNPILIAKICLQYGDTLSNNYCKEQICVFIKGFYTEMNRKAMERPSKIVKSTQNQVV